jgi:hypothetical protein
MWRQVKPMSLAHDHRTLASGIGTLGNLDRLERQQLGLPTTIAGIVTAAVVLIRESQRLDKSVARQPCLLPTDRRLSDLPCSVPTPPVANARGGHLDAIVGSARRLNSRSIRCRRGLGVRQQDRCRAVCRTIDHHHILMSLVIDQFGWFGMDIHPFNGWRMLGAALMVAGNALVAGF